MGRGGGRTGPEGKEGAGSKEYGEERNKSGGRRRGRRRENKKRKRKWSPQRKNPGDGTPLAWEEMWAWALGPSVSLLSCLLGCPLSRT